MPGMAAGQMRLTLHTWQPPLRLDRFSLHIYAVDGSTSSCHPSHPRLGHLRFLFSFNIGKSFKCPQFCNPLHQQMLGCWGEEAVGLPGPGPELLSKVNAGSQGRGRKEGSDTQ